MSLIKCFKTDIYYEKVGQGPVLLLLHGLGSSHTDWQAQIEQFQQKYTVITPDLPLHGNSGGRPEDFNLGYCAEIIYEFLRQLDLKEVTLVGISLGGMIALEVATRYPEKISRVVITNTIAECKARTWAEKWMFFTRKFLLKFYSMESIAQFIGNRLLPNEKDKKIRLKLIARWSENDRQNYTAATYSLLDWQIRDKLCALKCPLLVLGSEFDYTSSGAKKVLAYLFPDGQFRELENAHHLVTVESPALFNQAVESWLTEHKPLSLV